MKMCYTENKFNIFYDMTIAVSGSCAGLSFTVSYPDALVLNVLHIKAAVFFTVSYRGSFKSCLVEIK